jgi:DNA-binding MarR family transcriptional regulator
MPAPRDSVDALLASWAQERPDLDFSPVAVISRLGRLRSHIDAELDRVFAAHGLGAATFGVLVTLARIGGEHGISQRRLMEELGLTSGTISVRMDRLVDEGLVDRRPDPQSRRTTLITLTERGRSLFERVAPEHLGNERRLLAALDDDEQTALAALLRKLLVEFEGSSPEAEPPLGMVLAPAHVTIAMRESVGLPGVAGLLVRAVTEGGPAAAAGLRTGDVLLAAGGSPLRSIAPLYEADGELQLRVLRGGEERDVTITPAAAVSRAASAGPAPRGEHTV